jgi:5-methylcytosine-specific restriction endonuclease McrA
MNDFKPYSKEQQIGKQRDKTKPQAKPRTPKKKKNPHLYRGRIIPSRKERTSISPADYNKMVERYGNYCLTCGHTPIAAHHLIFRSHIGTGNWRNLAPLCIVCHGRVHKEFSFAEELRDTRRTELGPHFGKDKFSLFKENLIPNTTDEAYERFMKMEEEKARDKNIRERNDNQVS